MDSILHQFANVASLAFAITVACMGAGLVEFEFTYKLLMNLNALKVINLDFLSHFDEFRFFHGKAYEVKYVFFYCWFVTVCYYIANDP